MLEIKKVKKSSKSIKDKIKNINFWWITIFLLAIYLLILTHCHKIPIYDLCFSIILLIILLVLHTIDSIGQSIKRDISQIELFNNAAKAHIKNYDVIIKRFNGLNVVFTMITTVLEKHAEQLEMTDKKILDFLNKEQDK